MKAEEAERLIGLVVITVLLLGVCIVLYFVDATNKAHAQLDPRTVKLECTTVRAEGFTSDVQLCKMPHGGWCVFSENGVGCYGGELAPATIEAVVP